MATRTRTPVEPSLRHNRLHFGDVSISFQRTLRIPDDGREYPLPPGLGHFPVLPVSHFADCVPDDWRRHGGVFIPMHQREALWISLSVSDPWARAAVSLYDSDRAAVGCSAPLTEVWSIAELDEARIGPAAPIDPSIELDGEQVVGLGGHRAGLDGEW